MGMPSRHISPQSFDDILSELGNDPAIADPHGIRKPNNPKNDAKSSLNHPQNQVNIANLAPPPELKKYALWGALGIAGATLVIASFHQYDKINSSQISDLQASEQRVTELKKELDLLRNEILDIEDELYKTIDEIEVSVHSLTKKGVSTTPKSKNQNTPFELELARWRYLGTSRLGVSERVFLHNGKTTLMFETGSLVLGDWRLTSINKDSVVLTHPIGKSVSLKPSKTE
jgi:hypothetical protein